MKKKCGQWDSNPHGYPLAPKTSASANSAMAAYFLMITITIKNKKRKQKRNFYKEAPPLMRHRGFEPRTT